MLFPQRFLSDFLNGPPHNCKPKKDYKNKYLKISISPQQFFCRSVSLPIDQGGRGITDIIS